MKNYVLGFACEFCDDNTCSDCQDRWASYKLEHKWLKDPEGWREMVEKRIRCFEIVSICDKCDGKGELEKEIDGVAFKATCPECKGEKFSVSGVMLMREVPFDTMTKKTKKNEAH